MHKLLLTASFFFSLLFILFSGSAYAQPNHNAADFEKEIVAFEKFDQNNPVSKENILFVGSSSIRLWDDLASRFPQKKVVNRGFGGSWLSDVVYYFDRVVLPYRPKKIVIYAGENDIAGGKSAEELAADFEALLKLWRQKLPKSKFIFISLKPSPVRFNKMDEVRKANDLIRQRLTKERKATYIDVFAPMLGPDGKPREELFKEDRLHMNKKGYDIWEAAIRPYL